MAEYGVVLAVITIGAVGVFTLLAGWITGSLNKPSVGSSLSLRGLALNPTVNLGLGVRRGLSAATPSGLGGFWAAASSGGRGRTSSETSECSSASSCARD